MEDYVNEEVLKLLKDKRYFNSKANNKHLDVFPHLYDVLKWLRSAHKIYVSVDTDYNGHFSFICSKTIDDAIQFELLKMNVEHDEIFKYKTYEEALNNGIITALTKMIK